eukprot:TRINITY_DN1263_c0_g1_i1.p1 TRINITY_DN1263_c0_g1~~TRINITY_DN1263_c0_g1_i1.p1  ORF type:complete len:344 (-),score=100.20 TRINITY_DN1263_c0_g1_i1:361-1392(-)
MSKKGGFFSRSSSHKKNKKAKNNNNEEEPVAVATASFNKNYEAQVLSLRIALQNSVEAKTKVKDEMKELNESFSNLVYKRKKEEESSERLKKKLELLKDQISSLERQYNYEKKRSASILNTPISEPSTSLEEDDNDIFNAVSFSLSNSSFSENISNNYNNNNNKIKSSITNVSKNRPITPRKNGSSGGFDTPTLRKPRSILKNKGAPPTPPKNKSTVSVTSPMLTPSPQLSQPRKPLKKPPSIPKINLNSTLNRPPSPNKRKPNSKLKLKLAPPPSRPPDEILKRYNSPKAKPPSNNGNGFNQISPNRNKPRSKLNLGRGVRGRGVRGRGVRGRGSFARNQQQ